MSEHRATQYLINEWGRVDHKNLPPPMSSQQSDELAHLLIDDASDYFGSGVVSLCDAISSLEAKSWSWASVKLYYSVFYFARSYLATDGLLFTHLNGRSYWMRAMRGAVLKGFPSKRAISSESGKEKKKLSGTHGSVLYMLEHNFSHTALVDQEIDGVYPTQWMMDQREYFNYKKCGFSDPEPPAVLQKVCDLGVRKAVSAYLEDDYFSLDRDHALLAYPIKFFKETYAQVSGSRSFDVTFFDERKTMMRRLAKDSSGPLEKVMSYFY
ncbi:hypothetical protein ACFPTY_18635 [Halomonas beimenensis]|uniref:Uncharacterized protein n=1 Tax=Halomonas beimenensis TaxID=475662 RepID=A0A291P2Z1_9GAMM|nr:hypothetical protein [Halomonas beimenensis]ATJ81235.1 hypothetical protein BEI_0248 [Halomonas beimenensis]